MLRLLPMVQIVMGLWLPIVILASFVASGSKIVQPSHLIEPSIRFLPTGVVWE